MVLGRDHNLPAKLEWDVVFRAEFDHAANSLDCQPRLRGTGLVVEPAVQHAAVVPGLMARRAAFLFEEKKLCAGHTPEELASCRQTNNPTSDDDDSSLHSDQSTGIPFCSDYPRMAGSLHS